MVGFRSRKAKSWGSHLSIVLNITAPCTQRSVAGNKTAFHWAVICAPHTKAFPLIDSDPIVAFAAHISFPIITSSPSHLSPSHKVTKYMNKSNMFLCCVLSCPGVTPCPCWWRLLHFFSLRRVCNAWWGSGLTNVCSSRRNCEMAPGEFFHKGPHAFLPSLLCSHILCCLYGLCLRYVLLNLSYFHGLFFVSPDVLGKVREWELL